MRRELCPHQIESVSLPAICLGNYSDTHLIEKVHQY